MQISLLSYLRCSTAAHGVLYLTLPVLIVIRFDDILMTLSSVPSLNASDGVDPMAHQSGRGRNGIRRVCALRVPPKNQPGRRGKSLQVVVDPTAPLGDGVEGDGHDLQVVEELDDARPRTRVALEEPSPLPPRVAVGALEYHDVSAGLRQGRLEVPLGDAVDDLAAVHEEDGPGGAPAAGRRRRRPGDVLDDSLLEVVLGKLPRYDPDADVRYEPAVARVGPALRLPRIGAAAPVPPPPVPVVATGGGLAAPLAIRSVPGPAAAATPAPTSIVAVPPFPLVPS
ncbi:hypothetical protein THAOC_37110 [Thalassiosira oceanica]|uniref:Uncharacterized protein n=1 Tax=Thalassiosira oceanica TaxID=159749 RepID=K0QYR5_THAOC|nr:hypothetical protein THAOC_37110 [Thalassiosira oceanica]|eukprot:EJK44358.1 hypothetical protein THAOC_37110 [Thalassiosira oceanica]